MNILSTILTVKLKSNELEPTIISNRWKHKCTYLEQSTGDIFALGKEDEQAQNLLGQLFFPRSQLLIATLLNMLREKGHNQFITLDGVEDGTVHKVGDSSDDDKHVCCTTGSRLFRRATFDINY